MSRLPRDRAKGAAGGRLALAILVTALALPATAGEREPATSRGARAATGELLLFVRPEQGAGPPVVLRLAAIEAIDPDGTAVAVGEAPHEMRSDRGVGTGAALARGELPPGPYVALRLVLEPPEGAAAPPPIRVDVPFRVEAGRAVSVFLAWDPRRAPAAAFRADAEGPDVRSLLIFVTNRGGDEVTVIRRDRNAVVGVVKVGRAPMGIDHDPAGLKVYVANSGSDSVSIIDSVSRRVLDVLQLRFGSRPVDLAVSRDGLRLFVVSADRSAVTMYSTASLQELAETDVGVRPARIVVSLDDTAVYVANEGSNSVSILNARTLAPERTVPVESRPRELAVEPRAGRVYVGHGGSDGVAVVGFSRTRERILHFGGPVSGLAFDREGRRLYVTVGALGRLLVAQANSENVTGFLTLRHPGRMALDPDGKKIYVLDAAGDRVQVVDRILVRSEGSIPTGADPQDLVLLP